MAPAERDEEVSAVMAEQELEQQQRAAIHYRVQMYKVVIPVFLALSLLAILANMAMIAALRSARVRRNATVTLLLSLTSSDIWSCLVMALSLLYNSYLPIVLQTRVEPCLALSLEMLRTGGLLTAALHLLLIALHHAIGIIRPHHDKQQLRRTAIALCALAWTMPPTALWALALAYPGQGFWNCERVDFYHARAFRWAVSGLLAAIFLAISLCYAKLLHIMRSQHSKWPPSSASSAVCGRSPPLALSGTDRKRRRRERRTLWTTLLICLSFLAGWAPASVLFALTCTDCQVLSGPAIYRLLFLLSCVQLTFLIAKSLLNPLIYSLRIPEVSTELRHFCTRFPALFWCCASRLPLFVGKAPSAGRVPTRHGSSGRSRRSHLFVSSNSSDNTTAVTTGPAMNGCCSAKVHQMRPMAMTLDRANNKRHCSTRLATAISAGNTAERSASMCGRHPWGGQEEH